MKVIWCWRCKMDIPMLEPDEAERVFAAQNSFGALQNLPTRALQK
jgi:hypothetical protein